MSGRKRPMGLKGSSAKKQKNEEESHGVEKPKEVVDDHTDEKTATVLLKNQSEGISDEIAELEEVYNNALQSIDSDQQQATLLFQGTIHECDYIVKSKDNSKTLHTLPNKLYFIYGSSLFNLSQLAEPSDSADYLKLAIERLDQALGDSSSEQNLHNVPQWKILSSLGKAKLSLAKSLGESKDYLDSALENLSSAISELFKITNSPDYHEDPNSQDPPFEHIILLLDMVLSFAQGSADIDQISLLTDWTKSQLKKYNGSDLPQELLYFDAKCQWVLSSYYLDILDQEEDNERDNSDLENKVISFLSSAEKTLTDAKTKPESILLPEIYILLGEVLLNKGNFQDDEDIQSEYYTQSVKYFKLAQKTSENPEILSEHLQEFVSEWDQ
ncbi:hypothetical protein BB559_002257 [Furculomyces boomerangus]|uniref:Enhancer of translation termination 1 n=1 Tax=Furculomyces boomerangus TaxID=61424 RepID=A0A2T9YWS7_9FUNG|nr:hypothetical protein BB559_002257 [Furculomyces boomerangus]